MTSIFGKGFVSTLLWAGNTALAQPNADVAAVAARLDGELSNAEQVATDPKNFVPIEYSMCPAVIGGHNLPAASQVVFGEQRIALPQRTITRFALYFVHPGEAEGRVEIVSAGVKNSDGLSGLCKKSLPERTIALENVSNLNCTISYVRDGDSYLGHANCPSSFQGSARMTIDESLTLTEVSVWERWYSEDGRQVAGSTTGPYIYKRR